MALRAVQESLSVSLRAVKPWIWGRRDSEILSLQWRQINLRRQTVPFLNTKGKEDRVVPLDKATVQLLSDHWHKMFPDAIIPHDWMTTPLFISYMKPGKQVKSIYGAWNTARKRAGLGWLRIHDLRHILASRAAEKGGADIAALAELLGHKNLKHTQRYRHVTQRHNAAIVEKMAEATWDRSSDLALQRKR